MMAVVTGMAAVLRVLEGVTVAVVSVSVMGVLVVDMLGQSCGASHGHHGTGPAHRNGNYTGNESWCPRTSGVTVKT